MGGRRFSAALKQPSPTVPRRRAYAELYVLLLGRRRSWEKLLALKGMKHK